MNRGGFSFFGKEGKERACGKEIGLGHGLRLKKGTRELSIFFLLSFLGFLLFSCMCQFHWRAKEIHEFL